MSQDALTQQILHKITPNPEERLKVNALRNMFEQKIQAACQSEGIDATVRVEGSVAKDTWLSENPDIDIFMRLPTSIARKNLEEVSLRIAKKAAGNAKQLERFAEHPYLEIFVDGYRVDIVPCYDVKHGEWQSATDRTPYHTDYICTHLGKKHTDEVRLLKKFMQGIGVYGAEIKVGGFSGYLCELLVMQYGSFNGVIEAFATYSKRVIVDIENVYADHVEKLELLFAEPLVIVDPVDKGRNVASAVQPQKLYEFIGAARAYLKVPSQDFFYPPPIHAFAPDVVKSRLAAQTTTYLYVAIGGIRAVSDVLWGQLYRTKRSLRRLLETHDFRVFRDAVWSNESTRCVFVFELEQQVLPCIKKHLGPQLERQEECEKFLAKYADKSNVYVGPYIENGRWVVEMPHRYADATTLLQEKLSDGGKTAGTAELIAEAIKQNFKVMGNVEVLEIYRETPDFAVFLTEFLLGKPFWLVSQKV
ncbi:MAG: CCA tRNA nucleotidyltransferase [Nitrososphaerota archaeon]|jgi:tRNA nucleotidyltransferase (CCA-adding enzyme)|uniref:CCA tRNA nucleotidyltransferase n=1 Tax=Candidatus Bathycorpusculum sp. TaxID=2994959 RepID=UPI002816C124|nr:CCA tRNA nucleotidyltransferase [Candidatus Termitimicrobium sp.]MCL2432004.1 CCA tRNA nucleotidyltransferase [Candidatus Termitimicrobium sp.]MDR0492913.1 CCA tRNA nucleotidyltransferase [Nitrososphaerota archaeon]